MSGGRLCSNWATSGLIPPAVRVLMFAGLVWVTAGASVVAFLGAVGAGADVDSCLSRVQRGEGVVVVGNGATVTAPAGSPLPSPKTVGSGVVGT
jgi:hypothetical protein